MLTSSNPFACAAAESVAAALGVDSALFVVTEPPSSSLGDYAVGCFPAAKALKKPPPVLAQEAVEKFSSTELLLSADAAGPFVNFRVDRQALFRHVTEHRQQLLPQEGADQTICIDYSSPNIAKQLAYHHIRSTVIGHALANVYKSLGYRVIGINHLGDWGTTHGFLMAAYERWGAPERLTIAVLNDLYVRFRKAMEEEDGTSLEESGRDWFRRLEEGDPEARRLWKLFRDVSLAEFQEVYDELGIAFEEIKGESEYEEAMPAVIEDLEKRGLAQRSEGALVVPLDDLEMPPLLLRKQDGTTLYSTRDLAAARYRWRQYHFAKSLYVVDRGQGLHFRQLFAVLEKAGDEWASRCGHVSFGLVRIGGKKTGTRSGNVVLLRQVLREAAEGVRERIRENNPDWDAARIDATAQSVGIGAVVFANLLAQRDKDVDFTWEDVLRFEGDSGPYVQYSHARCASILRKAAELEVSTGEADFGLLTHDLEWAVARRLCDFGDVVSRAAKNNELHGICRYLLDVCAVYSTWYTAGNQDASLRVLCDDAATRQARLELVRATQKVLQQGLGLLGVDAPEAM